MSNSQSLPNTFQSFVTEVEVEKLFNLYSYRLAFDRDAPVDLSRLLILYGDNGSGKTTLLSLIFNLLSPARSRGHRTILAATPFRRFAVRLGTDLIVETTKVDGLLGSFRATIRNGERIIFDQLIKVREETEGISVGSDNQQAIDFGKALNSFGIGLYYLSDDRKTRSSLDTKNDEHEHLLLLDEAETLYGRALRQSRKRRLRKPEEQALDVAVLKLEKWLRSQAIKGSSEGEANTNTIYAEIVKQIARAKKQPSQKDSTRSNEELVRSLRQLEERSKEYSAYELITPLHVGPLLATLESSSGPTRRIIANVLNPYVDGLRARLDALQGVQTLIKLFIDSINSFFHNKSISFGQSAGLQIVARNGDQLKPQMLSSGERQILLLFCNVLTAREQATIFIIDEPELSLNIKWQRRLLQVLLDCTKDSSVQFVIATHSIEIITRHKPHVLKLLEQSQPYGRTR